MNESLNNPSEEQVPEQIGQLEATLAEQRQELRELRRRVAMAEAERDRFRAILNAIPHPIFAKTTELRYSVCNPAFERFLGMTADQILGKTVYEVADRDKANVYHAADVALLASGGDQSYEAKVRYHDGSDHDVIFHKSALPQGDEDVGGLYGFMNDITELRRAEQERRMLEGQLHHALRIQTVGSLAGGLAHDLNNLLTPILGYTGILLAGVGKEDPRWESLDAIRRASTAARDLVRKLLVLGGRQAPKLETLDLRSVVGAFESILRGTIPESIRIEVDLPRDPVWIRADAGQVEQVLMNLVVNARDAMQTGGVLTIRVREGEPLGRDGGEKLPSQVHWAILEVRDTGSGMDESSKERIFEPFFSTKEPGHGSGLGLPTVERIVGQHGGGVLVTSAAGAGSVFEVCLPKMAAPDPSSELVAPHGA